MKQRQAGGIEVKISDGRRWSAFLTTVPFCRPRRCWLLLRERGYCNGHDILLFGCSCRLGFPHSRMIFLLLRHMVRIFNTVEYLSHPDVNEESLEVEVMCGSWRARFRLVKTRHLSACSLEGKYRFACYFSNFTPLESQQGKLYSINIVRKNAQSSIVQRSQASLPPAGSCHCCGERHRS